MVYASLAIHRLRTTSPDFTKSFAIQHDQIVASAVLKGVLRDKDLSFTPRPISDLLDAIPSIPNLEIDSVPSIGSSLNEAELESIQPYSLTKLRMLGLSPSHTRV